MPPDTLAIASQMVSGPPWWIEEILIAAIVGLVTGFVALWKVYDSKLTAREQAHLLAVKEEHDRHRKDLDQERERHRQELADARRQAAEEVRQAREGEERLNIWIREHATEAVKATTLMSESLEAMRATVQKSVDSADQRYEKTQEMLRTEFSRLSVNAARRRGGEA